MKHITLCILSMILWGTYAHATDVTFADKTTGGSFTAADANEIKAAVNSKLDITATPTPTSLGLVIGTNVQAYDADLADLADGSLTGSKVAAATNSSQGAATAAQITELERLSAVAPVGSDTHYGLIINNNTASYADCTSGVYGINFIADTAYMCLNGTNTAIPTSSSGITDIVQDTTPQLGGDLDLNGHVITGYSALVTTTPGTGVATFLATPSLTNFLSALTGEGAFSATLLGYADAAATFTGIKQTASTTATGVSELATTAETTTGTDAARVVTPDGLSGSVYGQKEIGWTVVNDTTDTAVADGLQAGVIPASMNGMNLMDVTCSVGSITGATSGTTTVVLRRVRGATAVDMTSTGVTIDYNAYTASDETVNTSNDDVATGDKIFVDINAVSAGAAAKGLSCTAVFQTP